MFPGERVNKMDTICLSSVSRLLERGSVAYFRACGKYHELQVR